jgi:hypothetical protein
VSNRVGGQMGSEMRQHRDTDHRARVDTYFVWIFYQDILPFGHLQAQVCHGSNYTPAVRQGNVKLGGKIHWAHGRRAQNYMSGVVPRVRARNVARGQVVRNPSVWEKGHNFLEKSLPDFHLFRAR